MPSGGRWRDRAPFGAGSDLVAHDRAPSSTPRVPKRKRESSTRRERPRPRQRHRATCPAGDIVKIRAFLYDSIERGDYDGVCMAVSAASRTRSGPADASKPQPSSTAVSLRTRGPIPSAVWESLRGPEEISPLSAACRRGRLEIARELRRLGASTREFDPPGSAHPGFTPLHHAVAAGRASVAQWLVTRGGAYGDADIEAADGKTTPRSLGLNKLLNTAKRADAARERLRHADERRRLDAERDAAREVVRRVERKRRDANWHRRLAREARQDAVERAGLGSAGAERWDAAWQLGDNEDMNKYTMSRSEWLEFVRAQETLKRVAQRSNGGRGADQRSGKGSSGSREEEHTTTPCADANSAVPGSQETFLELEAKWSLFEERLDGKMAPAPLLSVVDVPFPALPPPGDWARLLSFGFWSDFASTLKKDTQVPGVSKAKRVIRTLYLRFHPDRVRVRLAGRCAYGELDKIVTRAKAATQALTEVKRALGL